MHDDDINAFIHQATIDNQSNVNTCEKPMGYRIVPTVYENDECKNAPFPTDDVDLCVYFLFNLTVVIHRMSMVESAQEASDFIFKYDSLEFSKLMDYKDTNPEIIMKNAKQIKSLLCNYRDGYQITNEHTEKINRIIEKIEKLVNDATRN